MRPSCAGAHDDAVRSDDGATGETVVAAEQIVLLDPPAARRSFSPGEWLRLLIGTPGAPAMALAQAALRDRASSLTLSEVTVSNA